MVESFLHVCSASLWMLKSGDDVSLGTIFINSATLLHKKSPPNFTPAGFHYSFRHLVFKSFFYRFEGVFDILVDLLSVAMLFRIHDHFVITHKPDR